MGENLLEMRGISKSFPGVKALDCVQITVKKGEVHALLGENGAGKSTLIKILGGIYAADSGEIAVDGKKVEMKTVDDARAAGISIVHQELCLCNNLSVARNIFLGQEVKKGVFCDDERMNREAEKLLNGLGMEIGAEEIVGDLTIAKQQMVEIARAISGECKILVLDEPTGTLTDVEIEKLFLIVNRLKKMGVGVIYVSHRLEEIFELADTLTVFRDGQYIGTRPVGSVKYEELVNMLIGREMTEMFAEKEHELGEVALEARNVCASGRVKDCSFYVRKGEILGFYGLVGSGRTELMRAIVGIDRMDSGTVIADGKEIRGAEAARKNGIQLVPEDRKGQGLVLIQSVGFNISLGSLPQIFRGMKRNAKLEDSMIKDYIGKLRIKTPSEHQTVQNLSGGNQQKVVIAKSLATNPKVLILDEPTRGIDVGAKKEIYDIMSNLADEGVAIIMISSELPEVIHMSNRAVIMHEGVITGEISDREMTQENMLILATGGKIKRGDENEEK